VEAFSKPRIIPEPSTNMLPNEVRGEAQGDQSTVLNIQEFNISDMMLINKGDKDTMSESSDLGSSSLIWVILFSIIILFSILTNTVLLVSILVSRRTWTIPRFLVCLLFLYNLLDYILLVLESSLGASAEFNYNETFCKMYQLIVQAATLFTPLTILLLVLHVYCSKNDTDITIPTRMFRFMVGLIIVVTLLSLPSLFFSGLAVSSGGGRHCVVDLGGLVGLSSHSDTQSITAAYYLIFKTVLPFWLPVCLALLPLIRLGKRLSKEQDKLGIHLNLGLVVGVSHGIFQLPYVLTVTIRYVLILCSIPLSPHTWWSLEVTQSLFLLTSFFSHLFRPLACLLLDHELPTTRMCSNSGYSTVSSPQEETEDKI